MRRDSADRFRVLRQLGSGGFGVVYEAYDQYLNRIVALKLLEQTRADALLRFKQEFRALSGIRHRNLVTLYELLSVDGRWMFSMELVRGADLLEHLALNEIQDALLRSDGPTLTLDAHAEAAAVTSTTSFRSTLSPRYVARLRQAMRQLALGIAVLHTNQILHCDIKPSNILITMEGRVVILDFGLLHDLSREKTKAQEEVLGTPGYMSPEQIRGQVATPASDWYSFGVVLFQALTGALPFSASTVGELLMLQHSTPAPHPSTMLEGIPGDLDRLCGDLLKRDPQNRPDEGEILRRLGIAEFGGRPDDRVRVRSTFLIGRDSELERVSAWLEDPKASQICLIHGSPGVGKTALLDVFLKDLRLRRKAVILGTRCYERESMPYKTIDGFVDSLSRYLLGQSQEVLDQIVPPEIGSLAQLFPVLLKIPRIELMVNGQFEDLRPLHTRIDEAAAVLGKLLRGISRKEQLIVVIEDTQWGDYESAAMFVRASREAGHSRSYVLLSCHRTEDAQTSLFLQMMRGSIDSAEVVLAALTPADAAKLAHRMLEDRPDLMLHVPLIASESGGNPLLMRMLVEFLLAAPPGSTPTLASAVQRLLEGESEAAQRLFDIVLVSATSVEARTALRAAGVFEGDEPVRALTQAGLIRSRWTGNREELSVFHRRILDAVRPTLTTATVRTLRKAVRVASEI